MVETNYVTLTCDDDIPIPLTLEKASVVLDKNDDIGGVLGDHVFLRLNDKLNKGDYGDAGLAAVGELYPTVGIMEPTATERLLYFIKYLCNTMFLMTRADQYIECVPSDGYKINFAHFSAEYMWMFTSALCRFRVLRWMSYTVRSAASWRRFVLCLIVHCLTVTTSQKYSLSQLPKFAPMVLTGDTLNLWINIFLTDIDY